jgi:sec-independent protein translocase protein TatB
MFDIGWTELMVIAVVAIVVIGPKDLPRAMRLVGQWTGKMKRMARDFQGQFNEALKEAELDGVKKDVEEISKGMRADLNKVDAGVRSDLNKIQAAATPASPSTPPAAATPAPAAVPAADPASLAKEAS